MTAKFDGTIQFDGLQNGDWRKAMTERKCQIVIGRTGEVRIMDVKNDRLLITNNVPYGATLNVKDGQKVSKGRSDLYMGSVQQCRDHLKLQVS